MRQTWKPISPLALITLATMAALIAASVGAFPWSSSAASASARTAGGIPSGNIKPGTVVHFATCEQAPPQSVKDRAIYTPEELAQYGLPPKMPGEPFEKWASIVRTAGQRVCDYTLSNDRFTTGLQSTYWSGWIAKQGGSDNYTESDLDLYVPCASIPPLGYNGSFGSWVGIGGYLNGQPPAPGQKDILVQAGFALHQYHTPGGWINNYQVFWEDTGASNSNAVYSFSLNCGDHLYSKVWDSNGMGCMYVQRISDGMNMYECSSINPASDGQSAEAIVEKDYNTGYPYFPQFGSQTFFGVGFTDAGNYKGFLSGGVSTDQVNQWYCTIFSTITGNCISYGEQLASVGSVQNDPGDNPYDEYAVTWLNRGNGSWKYCENVKCQNSLRT